MKSLEERRHLIDSKSSVLEWQERAFILLQRLRDTRCDSDQPVSSSYLSVLAFYIDHTLLVINTYTSKDLLSCAGHETCPDCLSVFQQTLTVAMRLVDLLLFDQLLLSIAPGFHNMPLVMISHAAIKIFNILKRGWRLEDTSRAVEKLKLISSHMERTTDTLPSASYAKMYLEMFRLLALQLDSILATPIAIPEEVGPGTPAFADPPWARMGATPRCTTLQPEQTMSLDDQVFGFSSGLDLSSFGLGSGEFDTTTWGFSRDLSRASFAE